MRTDLRLLQILALPLLPCPGATGAVEGRKSNERQTPERADQDLSGIKGHRS